MKMPAMSRCGRKPTVNVFTRSAFLASEYASQMTIATLPPLRTMSVRLAGQAANPNHGFRGELEIQTEDRVCVLDAGDPRELLLRIKKILSRSQSDSHD